MNVLIIEDEKPLVAEIRKYLGHEGFSCDEAFTGREASDKLWTNTYDVVLLDLGLPDCDGIDLLKEMIRDKKGSAVIILSARSSIEDRIKGLDLGADDYLPKPFSLLELKSRVLAVVRRKHGVKGNRLQISDHIWGDIIEENYNSNYIDVHIKNLRRKIGEAGGGDYIETVRGVGFWFNKVEG